MKPDPSIIELMRCKRPLFSVEFFPPKDDSGLANLREIARSLQKIHPDFVSVTYGAGGSTRERTREACRILRADFGYTVMPHLTCVGSTRGELLEIVHDLYKDGFRNLMALRGDPPRGETAFVPCPDGLVHASDLVRLVREHYRDICLGVGGYPEKHPEARDMKTDLSHLKNKMGQRADFITTQLFFVNKHYFDFVDACRKMGITVPIVAGIMPVLSLKQVQRFTEMCGAFLPKELIDRLEDAGDDAQKVENVGIEWALEQIQELLDRGAPGIHLYILNRSRAALALANELAGKLKL